MFSSPAWLSFLVVILTHVLANNVSDDTVFNDTDVSSNFTDHLLDSITYIGVENITDFDVLQNETDILIDTDTTDREIPPGKFDENEVVPENVVIEDLTLCNTTTGYLRGQTITAANGKQVIQYLGVPFAEPPVGHLRFQKPVGKKRWEGVHEAWTMPYSCMQVIDTYLGDFSGAVMWNANTPLSEDCLYMNIWLPSPKPANAPVMVWIYGGGFFSGTITLDIYNGAILASEQNVIVISIQYRLGPFGFYYLGTDDAPGNQGLYDQTLGLQWIQENVAHFGGHPKYVTLFGESAGAACVGIHLLSPVSSPLFMQAILQSGAPSAEWATVSRQLALNRSADFAYRLDCPSEPAEAVLECMRGIDAQRLVDEVPPTGNAFEYLFHPVIDGVFLPKAPAEMLKDGAFKHTNLLLGATANEGSYFLVYMFPELFQLYRDVDLNRSDFTEAVFKLFPNMSTLTTEALIFQYTDWSRPHESQALLENLEKIIGDKCITCDMTELATAYSATGAGVFMYEFAHRSSSSPWPKWMAVPHAQEIEYVFGKPLDRRIDYTDEERNLTKKIMTYWTNFARTGNPSLSNIGEFEKRFWPVHTPNGKEYLHISLENEAIKHGLRARQCAFWKTYLPSLTKTLQEIETAAVSARSFCTEEERKDREERTDSDPVLLEVEDEWAMEFEDWKKDHSIWKIEFNKYVETLEASRKLVLKEV